jgi:VIT1/CCC1 family predicted Fe2+/Mn2+ transporter
VRKINQEYLRSVLFGVEDSLVSTTGLVAGLGVGTSDKKVVILGGVVAIIVEAVSMGAGEYLSEDAVHELDKMKRHRDNPIKSGVLMLISYSLAGLLPLLPVLVFDYPAALVASILSALAGLFLLGYIKGRILKTSPWKGSLKIMTVGGLAAGIGILAGFVLSI